MWAPARSNLCYATTNRQRALREVAGWADAVVVVGSASSSNTASLVRTAGDAGCLEVVRVDGPDELPARLTGTVAVTARASAPESAVARVVDRLRPRDGVTVVRDQEEDERFLLPRELRARVSSALERGARRAGSSSGARATGWSGRRSRCSGRRGTGSPPAT